MNGPRGQPTEVLASLALWTKLLKGAEEEEKDKASKLCSVM